MNKAKFVKEITVIDPDTKGNVQISIYKHEAGGMFGIDSSFLMEFEDEVTIPDPFANKFRKVWLQESDVLTDIEKIEKIKDIISTWGNVTVSELELTSSPVISTKGSGRNNISILIEGFNSDEVHTITYHDEIEIDENFLGYEELESEVLDEVYQIILDYNTNQERNFAGLNDNKD